MRHVILFTVMWCMFNLEFNVSDKIYLESFQKVLEVKQEWFLKIYAGEGVSYNTWKYEGKVSERWSFITGGLSSAWSFIMGGLIRVVFHLGFFLSGWFFIMGGHVRMVFHYVWSLIRVVFHCV